MAFRALIAVSLLGLGLLFLPWQILVPLFVVGYAGYARWLFTTRIDEPRRRKDMQWNRTMMVLLLSLAIIGVTGTFLATEVGGLWTGDVYTPPTLSAGQEPLLNPEQLGTTLLKGTLIAAVFGVEMIAILLVSLGVRWYRQWLSAGVDSRTAAVRATLWELPARIPLYLLWALVVGVAVVYTTLTVEFIADLLNLPFVISSLYRPLYGDVLPVVIVCGHLIPAITIGGFVTVSKLKYDDGIIPEPLGYRGLFPPDDTFSAANVLVPVGLYLLYAIPVLLFTQRLVAVLALVTIPILASAAVSADPLGTTTRLTNSSVGMVPGIGGDAVVVGVAIGAALLVPFAVIGALLNGTLNVIPESFLLFPVVALPLSYGANRGSGFTKIYTIDSVVTADESEPVSDGRIDRMLAYTSVRDDRVRTAALEGLAVAAERSVYRRKEMYDVFRSAVERDDDAFARPGLAGIVGLLQNEPDGGEIPVTEEGVLVSVDSRLDDDDPETRRLATEAFARIIATCYESGDPPPLSVIEAIPVDRIERVVNDDPEDLSLRSAAVTCFAHLWYHRHELEDQLDASNRERLLLNLFDWVDDADERARETAVFAVVSDAAVVSRDELTTVVDALDSDHGPVRYMAAHVLRTSMATVARDMDPESLLPLLNDDFEPVARAAGEAIHEFVDNAPDRWEEVVPTLISHLADTDPTAAGISQATTLRTLTALDSEELSEYTDLAESVAGYVTLDDPRHAVPASRLLAQFLSVHPEVRREGSITAAIEAGLTHQSDSVRDNCLDAAAAIVAEEPGDGRPFVRGLVLTLGTAGEMSATAASCLSRILEEYPGYGTEVLPEMVGGLRNPTRVSEQYAGAMVVGMNVSEVTASILADVTDQDVSRGENLIEPLVDLSGSAGTGTLESILRSLENLSAEYPAEAEQAVPSATSALDHGNVRIRRSAARVLANIATQNPEAIEPVLSKLMITIDDDDPRTRATALAAIGLVAASNPEAIGSDIRRVIGRLDDDASVVRERAAEVLVTVAETEPELVEQSAEASDRLRRLQRDPAVDVDAAVLQDAASAIQSGVPSGEVARAAGDTEDDPDLYTVEGADEVGTSGDTKVFDPISDEGAEDICPSCWSDLSDREDLEGCPNCGEALE